MRLRKSKQVNIQHVYSLCGKWSVRTVSGLAVYFLNIAFVLGHFYSWTLPVLLVPVLHVVCYSNSQSIW